MATTHNLSNKEAFSERVDAVLSQLEKTGISMSQIQQRYTNAHETTVDPTHALREWVSAYFYDNPTAGQLTQFASSLDVNSTWLLTGDVRFAPAILADTCLCWETPAEYHFVHYGATEPGSAMEYNPDCPKHHY